MWQELKCLLVGAREGTGNGLLQVPFVTSRVETAFDGTSARRVASSLKLMELCGCSQAHWAVCQVQELELRFGSARRGVEVWLAWGENRV